MPGNSKPNAKSLLVDGIIVTDPKTVGNVFNGLFTSMRSSRTFNLYP